MQLKRSSLLTVSPDAEELFGFDIERCWASRVEGENQRPIYVELVGGSMAERRVRQVLITGEPHFSS